MIAASDSTTTRGKTLSNEGDGTGMKPRGAGTKATSRRKRKPGCESCFFGCRGLCALDLGGPCATFRPDTPDGLQPPVQPALLVRDEGAALAA
jgi:hypothetical protein